MHNHISYFNLKMLKMLKYDEKKNGLYIVII